MGATKALRDEPHASISLSVPQACRLPKMDKPQHRDEEIAWSQTIHSAEELDAGLEGTGNPVGCGVTAPYYHVLRGTIHSHLWATCFRTVGLSHLCPHSWPQRKHPASESPNACRVIKL